MVTLQHHCSTLLILFRLLLLLLLLLASCHCQPTVSSAVGSESESESDGEQEELLRALLLDIKASLDPDNTHLSSWTTSPTTNNNTTTTNTTGSSSSSGGGGGGGRAHHPCTSFEGVACNEHRRVVNISLQGIGLRGSLPPLIGRLRSLTGLYLHFNALTGQIPKEIGNLIHLTDLYLNVNNFTGSIPKDIASISSLQVLQLSYNKLNANLPTNLGSLKNLTVMALQYNQLTGAIPAGLGDLPMLMRLDLSFNKLFGSIPVKLADAPMLKALNVQNNTLSGNVPLALRRLNTSFGYQNNPGLCGVGFPSLRVCTASDYMNPEKPEPFAPGTGQFARKDIPESANFQANCSNTRCSFPSKHLPGGAIFGVIALTGGAAVLGLLVFSWHRRRKQKIGNAFDTCDSRLSTDQTKEVCRRSSSPLISLEYTNGWDPLGKGPQEIIESSVLTLEDVESATQHFAEMNLLGRSNYSAVYKGMMRDGSVVAVKCISKTSCKSDESEFLKGLKILTSLKNENLVRLRGFCCSRGRRECFLIYDFVSNGNLLQYLDLKSGNENVLEWSTRVSIIKGIAGGVGYIHAQQGNKAALVHRNLSAEKVLIDSRMNPLLAGAGLDKLLADDIVFSAVKSSAAMGYLAPEYTTTGRFTEKSDIYAFGMIVLQILTGKAKISHLNREGAESGRLEDFIDANLGGKFSASEAAKLSKIASICSHELPSQRPSMDIVIQDLSQLGDSS